MIISWHRLPPELRTKLEISYQESRHPSSTLTVDEVYCGDCRKLLPEIAPNSIALSFWSPPYFVGKSYESYLHSFEDWQKLLREVIFHHFRVLKPGGFMAVNIADILVFRDSSMPRIQADNVRGKRVKVTLEDVLNAKALYPDANRYQLAKILGCSEQTIDRRLHGNNIRGGKKEPQTRVKIVGGMIEQWALESGLYPYDRRIWVKDAAWENSRWVTNSYRSVDEFEYIYIFWKPGLTKFDRKRLTSDEWRSWGSRAVWFIPSVRANDDHEAKFPLELPRRLIRLLTETEEVVLDPFLGSGTTAVAAKLEGRHYLGIDLEPKYVELSKQNLARVESSTGGKPTNVK